MFNMKLLTLTSLIVPMGLASPMPTPSGTLATPPSISPTMPPTVIGRGPPFALPPGYMASGSAPVTSIATLLPTATATAPTTTSTLPTSGSPVALLDAHHLPDCLASDAGTTYIIWADTCSQIPTSFLSYTAKVTDAGVGQTCEMHVYSEGDCSGFESKSPALTGSMSKCTPTSLRVVDGLAGVGAVGVKMVCA